jgi:hypothetical protein
LSDLAEENFFTLLQKLPRKIRSIRRAGKEPEMKGWQKIKETPLGMQ